MLITRYYNLVGYNVQVVRDSGMVALWLHFCKKLLRTNNNTRHFCLSLHSFLKLEWCQYCNDLNLFVLRPIDNSIALDNDLSQIWRFFKY